MTAAVHILDSFDMDNICISFYNCLYIKIVPSIFEALNNCHCQCRWRVGKLGVQTSAKKGSICHLPTIIVIRLMYLPNIRSTIVPLATPIPPALLSYCISNNYQILIKYSYCKLSESNLKIMKQEVFIEKKIAF